MFNGLTRGKWSIEKTQLRRLHGGYLDIGNSRRNLNCKGDVFPIDHPPGMFLRESDDERESVEVTVFAKTQKGRDTEEVFIECSTRDYFCA